MARILSTIAARLISIAVLFFLQAAPAFAGPGGGTYYANSPPLRKFVDGLPGLGPTNANNLGQYLSIAHPDKLTYPGTDYYEIAVRDFAERMHSDLQKATKLRGYVQLNMGTNAAGTLNDVPPDPQHYLGPLIIAQKGVPVRIKFVNQLPVGVAGNLFIPVDTTVMGAGMGPLSFTWNPATNTFDPTGIFDMFTENRAELHLHGGLTPWISDGTPHQWITPAGDPTVYKQGVSLFNVPDMPNPGKTAVQGEATYYYTNAQSSRLMFYHDHSYGITRLNVYAGEAAGFLLRDDIEAAMEANGTLPALAYNLPLIIQDKTFVPDDIAIQDAMWDTAAWGQPGDLWFPHVYETNQDPTQPGGMSATGRWDYGPWFWPPALVTNPVLPALSIVPEAFMDTMMVNGTAYPYANVEPRRYRLRLLNASNDRTLNLQLYKADATGTEVAMIPPPAPIPRIGGIPDPTMAGPAFINIATEGGFLPAPEVSNDPALKQLWIGYDLDPRSITINNINSTNLLLGPAQRADVIVDFSTLAPGTKLILYNDCPAPAPAGDPRIDYYTGNGDHTATGGAPSTLPGFGPNTRTIMQFRVVPLTGTPDPETFATTLAKLSDPSPTSTTGLKAAFTALQDPLPFPAGTVVNNFTNYVFDTAGNKIPVLRKAIQELFDPVYGRMNALLGTELQWTNGQNQNTNFNYYTDLPTEIIPEGQTQVWMIVHNGVDTHFVHTHLVNVQIIGRVDWAGVVKPPNPDELGWRETFRADPLEQVIVAARGVKPPVPWPLPDSVRTLDVTMPSTGAVGSTWSAATNPNPTYNLSWEYVWHCHLLGHEENDMMRPLIFKVPTAPPAAATGVAATPDLVNHQINVTWTVDQKVIDEIAYTVERDSGAGFTKLADVQYVHNIPQTFFPTGQPAWPLPIYSDATAVPGTPYTYRIVAYNAFGSSISATATATLPATTPATGVTLTPSATSPHLIGTKVVFTAAATGTTSTVLYQFSLNGAVVQPYGVANTWTLLASQPAGTYNVQVDVKTDPVQLLPDATATVAYVLVNPPATGVTITTNLASPQTAGTPIVFTAVGKGSTGYQYRFWLNSGAGNVLAQDYGVGSTWTLPGTTAAGSYTVQVDVRTNATVALDAFATTGFVLSPVATPTPATALTITASAPSPFSFGQLVTFTATGSGSTTGGTPSPAATYQYEFWLWNGSAYTKVQAYSQVNTWTMTTTSVAGTYRVFVNVRTTPTVITDLFNRYYFSVVASAPTAATGVSVTANATSPFAPNQSVTFTATGSGSTTGGLPSPQSAYQFQYWLWNGSAYALVQDYSATPTWTMIANPTPGSYRIYVNVKTSGTAAQAFTRFYFNVQ